MTNQNQPIKSLADYSLLGRSGLRVSPLCLGTMTFGTEWGWGSPEDTARQIFDRYFDAGGNFLDTADFYTGGKSEELVGKFLKESGRRDRVALATKYSINAHRGDPNAGGNGRKNLYRALEGSLRRLQTDYIDLYWVHVYDGLTPVEEVVSTLDDLVRAGKVRYIGLSDTPAWYAARAQTIAELRGLERFAALQLQYSLAERNIEHEFVPAALELGLGICPWGALANGLLTGKYKRTSSGGGEGEGRLIATQGSGSPLLEKFTERNWKIVDVLVDVARQLGRPPSQVALSWITRRPGVSSTILGATKLAQLDDNLQALEFDIPAELSARLEEAGRPELVFPYQMFDEGFRGIVTGGTSIRREPAWYRRRTP